MRVLVDMDGVLAWWEKNLIRRMKAQYPDVPIFEFGERTVADLESRSDYQTQFRAILDAPGFYRELEPVEGGLEALQAMRAAGHDVVICTAPSASNPTCGFDKYEWIKEHLGQEWVKRTVIVFDKTLIDGDILIDDKLNVTGSRTPTWTHVIFDQSYNRVPDRLRMVGWEQWRWALAAVQLQREGEL